MNQAGEQRPENDLWVRAQDGGLYRDPVLVAAWGFVCFGEWPIDERPADVPHNVEAVFWIKPAKKPELPDVDMGAALRKLFGRYPGTEPVESGVNTSDLVFRWFRKRVVPGTEPWEFAPAAIFTVPLVHRIPVPLLHKGNERYASRCFGLILDRPTSPFDVVNVTGAESSQVLGGG